MSKSDAMLKLAQTLLNAGVDADQVNSALLAMPGSAETDAEKPKPKRGRKPKAVKAASSAAVDTSVEESTDSAEAEDEKTGPSRPKKSGKKTDYGQAPTVFHKTRGGGKIPDHEGTKKARIAALEKRLPGVSSWAEISYVAIRRGKEGKKCAFREKYTMDMSAMTVERAGFLWVAFPATESGAADWALLKKLTKKDKSEITAVMRSSGYGFSSGNKAWATDSSGNPVNRRNGKCQGVGREFIREAEED